MMKKVNTVLLGLGLVFLVWLIVRMGWHELWQQMKALGWGLALMIAVEGIANLAHTKGWQHCVQARKGTIPFWTLFRMNMAGWAINYLTPTASVGGELSRGTLLAANGKGVEAATSVLLDKLMTAVAHVLLVVLGGVLLFWRVSLPGQLWVAMVFTTVLLTSGMTAFMLLQRFGKLGAVCRWLAEHRIGGQFVRGSAQKLSNIDGTLKRFYQQHPRGLIASATWHFVGHSAALVHAWIFLSLLGQPTPILTVATAGLLSLWFDLLTFAIPMNLGTLEGSRIVVLKSLGCQALLGMAFGIAVRVAQLSWAGFGLICYAFLHTQPPASSVSEKPQKNTDSKFHSHLFEKEPAIEKDPLPGTT